MKEIKFRVWDSSDNKMYPNGSILVGNLLNAICGDEDPLSEEEKCIYKLMQYTGLHDKTV